MTAWTPDHITLFMFLVNKQLLIDGVTDVITYFIISSMQILRNNKKAAPGSYGPTEQLE